MAETSPTKHTPLSHLPPTYSKRSELHTIPYHTIPIPSHSFTNGHQPARHLPSSSLITPHVSNPSSAPDTQIDPHLPSLQV